MATTRLSMDGGSNPATWSAYATSSSTNSIRRPVVAVRSAATGSAPPGGAPSAPSSARAVRSAGTASPSCVVSRAKNRPSGYRSATSPASRTASVVRPTPGRPVTSSTRARGSASPRPSPGRSISARSSRTSRVRPTNPSATAGSGTTSGSSAEAEAEAESGTGTTAAGAAGSPTRGFGGCGPAGGPAAGPRAPSAERPSACSVTVPLPPAVEVLALHGARAAAGPLCRRA
ncbi:hypothetical protein [Streptomyces sp. CA-111067]|uniref:hypothetical protein n=1 Tax=Streptomyces sp. CA-111067 TaxID=3240046 RepID=UPI003D9559C3